MVIQKLFFSMDHLAQLLVIKRFKIPQMCFKANEYPWPAKRFSLLSWSQQTHSIKDYSYVKMFIQTSGRFWRIIIRKSHIFNFCKINNNNNGVTVVHFERTSYLNVNTKIMYHFLKFDQRENNDLNLNGDTPHITSTIALHNKFYDFRDNNWFVLIIS